MKILAFLLVLGSSLSASAGYLNCKTISGSPQVVGAPGTLSAAVFYDSIAHEYLLTVCSQEYMDCKSIYQNLTERTIGNDGSESYNSAEYVLTVNRRIPALANGFTGVLANHMGTSAPINMSCQIWN